MRMNPGWLFPLSGWLFPLCCALHVVAQVCLPSPVEAARSAVGEGRAPSEAALPAGERTHGYRVAALEVDPVLHRAWFRVVPCDRPGDPPRFVPLRVALTGDQPPQRTLFVPSAPADKALAPSQPATEQAPGILAGDPVAVIVRSSGLRMELQGRADARASIGETISVTLAARGDTPPHHIRGVLRPEHRVEVQP